MGPPELRSGKLTPEEQLQYLHRSVEDIKALADRRHEEVTEIKHQLAEMKQDSAKQFAEIMSAIKLNAATFPLLPNPNANLTDQSNTPPEIDSVNSPKNRRESFPKLPKLDLPTFDGNGPKEWLRKCEEYFTLNATAEDQKLPFCITYLRGFAELWYDVWRFRNPVTTWSHFSAALYERFDLTCVMAAAEAKQLGEMQGDESLEGADKLLDEMGEWGKEFLLGRHEDILVVADPSDSEDKAHEVFTEMLDVMRQPHSLTIGSLKDAHQLFDEIPKPVPTGPVKLSNEQMEENVDSNSSIQHILEGKLSFETNINDLEVAYHLFDEMPSPCMEKEDFDYMKSMIIQVSSLNNDDFWADSLSELQRTYDGWSSFIKCLNEAGKYQNLKVLNLFCAVLEPYIHKSNKDGDQGQLGYSHRITTSTDIKIPTFIFDPGGTSWQRMDSELFSKIIHGVQELFHDHELWSSTVITKLAIMIDDYSRDLLYYGWPNISKLEVVEHIYSNKGELKWFASPEAKQDEVMYVNEDSLPSFDRVLYILDPSNDTDKSPWGSGLLSGIFKPSKRVMVGNNLKLFNSQMCMVSSGYVIIWLLKCVVVLSIQLMR